MDWKTHLRDQSEALTHVEAYAASIYHDMQTSLDALKDMGDIDALPYSIKVLLESVVRNHDGTVVRDEDVRAVAQYDASKVGVAEVAYKPSRVVLQDFTGVPAIVDLAVEKGVAKIVDF